ncbi:MAG: cytochrome b/b6 domain-containing protein [Pseudomonadota bacterium]
MAVAFDSQPPATARYTSVAIVLHWTIAIAILFQLASGQWMVHWAPENSQLTFDTYQVHKTVGLIVLALSLARLYWRLTHKPPAPQPNWSAWEHRAAHAAHLAFYGLMIGAPLSGWLMVSVSPTAIPTFFGMVESLPFAHLPGFTDWSAEARKVAEDWLILIHEIFAKSIVLILLLHVAGALKHHFVEADGTLRRISFKRPSPGTGAGKAGRHLAVSAILATALIGGGLMAGQVTKGGEATERLALASSGNTGWVVDLGASNLEVSFQYSGAETIGTFGNWSADIEFDPSAPESGSVTVDIDLGQFTIADAYLAGQAGGSDGMDVATNPTARFVSTGIMADGDGYLLEGVLSFRGVDEPLTIPFTYEEVDEQALVAGGTVLDRLTFGVGAQNDPSGSFLGQEVTLRFELKARRADTTLGAES